ncbi:MAG: pitrilysin family protein [Deltaproteobacteria bacterium]|nr:pitrilysin family protein [Deltaproteobacteria bacterium]
MSLTRKLIPLLFIATIATAQEKQKPWQEQVVPFQLPNGMRFLLLSRGETPTFTAYIRFRVGGLDEQKGKTGLAHLFEHMAFKGGKKLGTKNYPAEKIVLDKIEKVGEELSAEYKKGKESDPEKIKTLRDKLKVLHTEEEKYLVKEEISKKIQEAGGEHFNATTSKDITSYFVSLPVDKMELWAQIESERIFFPILREFYEERDVVMEERRMRVDDDPSGKLYETMIQTAFTEKEGARPHPYDWPTIGLKEDLLTLTRKDAEDFFQKYYTPQNAVGVIVGKISIPETKKLLTRYFAKIPGHGPAPKNDWEPPLVFEKEKRITFEEKAEPRLMIGFYKPAWSDPEEIVFDLLDEILSGGPTSRLHKKLVTEKRIAAGIETYGGVPGTRLTNLFLIQGEPIAPHSLKELEAGILQVIDELKKNGPTTVEMEKARNKIKSHLIWGLKTNDGLASQLSYYETLGDWHYLTNYLGRIDAIGPEEVQKTVQKYFTPERRVVAELKKK